MSLHRLSAGAGYRYLLRHTACGDVERDPATPLTAYYTDAGYPPGRWLGTGLAGLGDGTGIASGTAVSEDAMSAVFGAGRDPITGDALGRGYPTFRTLAQRITDRCAALPDEMDGEARASAVARITEIETARRTRVAVAGFDLTFTAPKSASVLWALADPKTQAAVVAAHRAAVDEALALVEHRALFTRVGQRSCAQVPTRGMIAAAFDHWDTRTGDPNLHTHVVIANKVQGPDGGWRSVDSRALHHAVVAVSEVYDNLLADHLARDLPVSWSWRPRGPRRTPAFEVDGVGDDLLAEFSTRSAGIGAALQDAVVEFHATHGRGPSRVEILQLRQRVTCATRPEKTAHPLIELLRSWRDRAARLTGRTPTELSDAARGGSRRGRATRRGLRAGDLSEQVVARLAGETLDAVMARRSTWTRWNLLAETARTTRGLRLATSAERHALHDRVIDAALATCVALDPGEVFTVPADYRRPDGTSVFARPGEDAFTHQRILDAEQRLLHATTDPGAPTASEATARRIATTPQPARQPGGAPVRLADDQVDAIIGIATSGRRLEVLVGPAGTGKTTTLRALRTAWEATYGRGSVIGLAPSATAAHELADALHIGCENTAKWLHETNGPGALTRTAILDGLRTRREGALAAGDMAALRTMGEATLALEREQALWSLRAGQLLIVDEASLAGTFTLDTLTAQATAAGAKVLLVGDHRQLSAVDAGGAFGLLAERGAARELRSLWRFRHRWEAGASRLLRHGHPNVVDTYASHDRIHAGEADTMVEAAYQAWQRDTQTGQSAVLLATDAHTVDALNARAHDDLVATGHVAPDGIPAAGGVTVAVGDTVLTRRNNRRLHVPGGGHVRNGARWTVTATHPDGALTLAPTVPGTHHPRSEPRPEITVPADYVAEHVELGYATTIHRAQGVTVDHAHVLATPGMTREALYVAMTRGRDTNHAYVATDAVDPDCDQLPDPAGTPGPREILSRILATTGGELSATQTLAARHADATSPTRLAPIRATLIADQQARQRVPQASIARADRAAASSADDSAGSLVPASMTDSRCTPVQARGIESLTLERNGGSRTVTAATTIPGRERPHSVADAIRELDALLGNWLVSSAAAEVAFRPGWLPPRLGRSASPSDRGKWGTDLALLERYQGLSRASTVEPNHSRPDCLDATGGISGPEPYVAETSPDSTAHDAWVVTR
jgi:conjugative relaxase-like TrwC/TraI family protein